MTKNTATTSLALAAVTGLACAQAHGQTATTPPAKTAAVTPAAPAPGTINSFFNGQLPDAIGKSKINVNARLRFEHADQDGPGAANLKESNAPTLRTRFGLTTAPLYGFQAMLEGENVLTLGPSRNFSAAGSNPSGAGRTVIGDPSTTELNQGWLSYTNFDSTIKGGRQRINLDNVRFIGDSAWRQNMTTFDAVSFQNNSLKDFTAYYAYVWDVKRAFGNVSGLPAANTDYRSHSHLINLSYTGWKYGKIVGYSYLLGLKNAAGSANSTATYGGYIAGSVPANEKIKIDYRAEGAWQENYDGSLLKYNAGYYDFELGATIKPVSFGVGYEVLGSDNGVGFKTPLATLHAFNGWADVFLNTPAKGLRDLYPFFQINLPYDIPLRFVYHKFDAASGGADYGQEFDVQASKKLGKYWAVMAKYAHYKGEKAAPPSFTAPITMDKLWLQVEFNF